MTAKSGFWQGQTPVTARGWKGVRISTVRRPIARFRARPRVFERGTGDFTEPRDFSPLFSPIPSAEEGFSPVVTPFGARQRLLACGRADFLGFLISPRVGERTFWDPRRFPGWESRKIQFFGVSQCGKENFSRFLLSPTSLEDTRWIVNLFEPSVTLDNGWVDRWRFLTLNTRGRHFYSETFTLPSPAVLL